MQKVNNALNAGSFLLLVLALTFSACSSDDDEASVPREDLFDWCGYLAGTWHGEQYWSSIDYTRTEDITFSPYASAREYWGVYTGKVEADGGAQVTTWYGSVHECCFSISNWSVEPAATLSLYTCDGVSYIDGSEDKRTISVVSDSVFLMRAYGTAESNNYTYTRQ